MPLLKVNSIYFQKEINLINLLRIKNNKWAINLTFQENKMSILKLKKRFVYLLKSRILNDLNKNANI